MSNQKRRKKKKNRLINILIFLFIFVFIAIYINNNVIFKPFLSFQGDQKYVNIFKEWLNLEFPYPFITKKSIGNIQLEKINKSLSTLKMKRNLFLIWSLNIKIKASSRYILINNEIRVLDDNFYLLDVPFNQEEIKKQIPFLLKIEILEKLPIKSNNKKTLILDKNLVPEKNDIQVNKIDIFSLYQKEISPFVKYLFDSESSLGPKISLIQFFPKEGLRFILFNDVYWIGYNKNYAQIEKNLTLSEIYLKLKYKKQSYNEFDLRFQNQIICRNNQ